ncbi:MAG: flagellar hook-basal body complex protein FliE [Treponema sp.]|jgi:flagellar hook-basal body complex protein FliE|nr:flagellar hook-basal body complex protein FliE [Treponema sp.]
MTVFRPELVPASQVPLRVTNPKHFASAAAVNPAGQTLSELGNKVGAEAALRSGTFEDVMLQALDKVSAQQHTANNLIQAAITEPGSVDVHDITIAQANASLSLNITRTVLSRLVQSWKDLINTR